MTDADSERRRGAPLGSQRIAYLGTPEMAVPPLEALIEGGFEVVLVVTGADKRRGRGREVSPSPVKRVALAHGLAVTHDVDDVIGCGAQLGVVVAFGQIIRPHVLEQLPMVNLHFSLLPRWRGAAPVERAILAGDDRTGVCVMEVAEGLDTGAVHALSEVPIGARDTTATLRERLVEDGSALLVETLRRGLGEPEDQQGEPTYAHKLHPEDLEIDWSGSATHIDRLVRVGGAWTTWRAKRLKVLEAVPEPADDAGGDAGSLIDTRVVTGEGMVRLVRVQPEGKSAQDAQDWRNGARLEPGERLGT